MRYFWLKLSLLVEVFVALCLSNTNASKVGLVCDRSIAIIGKYLRVESASSLDMNADVSQTLDTRWLSQTEIIRVLTEAHFKIHCWSLNLISVA